MITFSKGSVFSLTGIYSSCTYVISFAVRLAPESSLFCNLYEVILWLVPPDFMYWLEIFSDITVSNRFFPLSFFLFSFSELAAFSLPEALPLLSFEPASSYPLAPYPPDFRLFASRLKLMVLLLGDFFGTSLAFEAGIALLRPFYESLSPAKYLLLIYQIYK